jgi:hypothetical protein
VPASNGRLYVLGITGNILWSTIISVSIEAKRELRKEMSGVNVKGSARVESVP